MKQLDRYVGGTVIKSILLVLIVMLSLDSVFRSLDELGRMTNSYTFKEVVIYIGLTLPAQLYRYLPYATLIGALVGLGSLSNTSELVVMQSSGVSVGRIVLAAIKPIIILMVIGQGIGEFVAPVAEQTAESRQALKRYGGKAITKSGIWNRENNYYMHFSVVEKEGVLHGVSVFEFNENSVRNTENLRYLKSAWFAQKAVYENDEWVLYGVDETRYLDTKTERVHYDRKSWDIGMTPNLLTFVVADANDLSLRGLWNYASYLQNQGQDSREHWLAFWEKVLQSLSTLSLVIVAVSVVFGSSRQMTMGFRVFVGVLIGVGFKMTQNLLGPASVVFKFPPLLAVLLPILICFVVGFWLLRRVR